MFAFDSCFSSLCINEMLPAEVAAAAVAVAVAVAVAGKSLF